MTLMSSLIKRWLPFLLFTMLPGFVVLLGYLIPAPALTYFRDRLVEGAVIVAAFAFLLGTFNILHVHGGKVLHRRRDWYCSLVLLLAMLVAVVPPILPPGSTIQRDLDHVVYGYVISPLGASLAALVVFTLALAAFRLMRTRRSAGAMFFLLVVAIVLLGSAPFVGFEWLASFRDWIVNVPGMAGMRGLLLGVALGIVMTALRVFLAIERPYGES